MQEGLINFPVGMVEGITFPTEYEEGVGITLPELKSWEKSDNLSYDFEGWYYDENFENKVENNIISKDKTGDVVVYAAIVAWVG